MTGHKMFLLILSLCMAVCISFQSASATEYEKDLGDPKLGNKVRIEYVDAFERDLKKIRKVAVLVTASSLFGGVAEEQLALELKNNGYGVVDRSKVSELMQKELFKDQLKKLEEQLELEKQLGTEDSRAGDRRVLEKRIEQLKQGGTATEKDILSLIGIGKILGLDAIVAGTLFEGRRQIAFNEDSTPLSMEKPVVSTFALQVIDIKTGSVIAVITEEYDKGESVSDAVRTMMQYIKEITR